MSLDIGQLFGDTFGTFFNNKTVLAFAVIGALLYAAFQLALESTIPAPLLNQLHNQSSLGTNPALASQLLPQLLIVLVKFFLVLAVGAILLFFLNFFVTGGLISAVQLGDKATLNAAAGKAEGRYFALLGTMIFRSMITTAILLVPFVVAAASLASFLSAGTYPSSSSSSLIGLILFIIALLLSLCVVVALIYVGLRLCLAPAAAVIGNNGIVDSIRMSWYLTGNNVFNIFLILLLVFIVLWVIDNIVSAIALVPSLSIVSTFLTHFFDYLWAVPGALIFLKLSSIKPPMPVSKTSNAKLVLAVLAVFIAEVALIALFGLLFVSSLIHSLASSFVPGGSGLPAGSTFPSYITVTTVPFGNYTVYTTIPSYFTTTVSPSNRTTVTAFVYDPQDLVARNCDLFLDKYPGAYKGSGTYAYATPDDYQLCSSGETLTYYASLGGGGPHTIYFIVTQSGGKSYGTYSGNFTIGSSTVPFSGVDATHAFHVVYYNGAIVNSSVVNLG